ncbi:MAG: serine/threonine-protein kinase PknG [Propionibacteriaceae bacterium]|nr:serine/threonine-protein kinase PknG [Propionibacteriaceae bacterium]
MAPAKSTNPAQDAPSPVTGRDKKTSTSRGVPGTVPSLVATGPCQMPSCSGKIVDGYCNTCGSPAGSTIGITQGLSAVTAHLATASLGSARIKGSIAATTRERKTSNHVGSLGAGLTSIPPEPLIDPLSAIMKNPEVNEDKRICPHCAQPVGRSVEGWVGALAGECLGCHKPYSFTPKLAQGDIIAGQYEVQGCLAHGGQGWIYLAQDRNVSNRWVVLKGLLNEGDEAAMEATMAEQKFLAKVQHPLIVEIYNFVTHEGGAYIVMEYVGGRSIKQILKDQMKTNKGTYGLDVDHALAYILEILPALSYLHHHGLLYCDFKPDNLLHLQDSVKLIDLGGVRHIDDDESTIFGTTGYQAPEVPTQGCSVASDIYTVGRTLLICCAEVKGYQTTYETSLPPISELPSLSRYDSVYRLIAKACAPHPLDRFSSIEEMREQMLGVLREVVGLSRGQAATTSSPSDLFEPPTVVADVFNWKHLPKLKLDPSDPGATVVASLDSSLPAKERYRALADSPTQSPEVQLALCLAALETGQRDTLLSTTNAMLEADPWEWRAIWMQGLDALNAQDWEQAQGCFNAVYSQVPGELAPKFALAVACEMGGKLDIAEQLYHVCTVTGVGYVAGSAFGLARVRTQAQTRTRDHRAVLDALDLVPATSGGFTQSRQLAATYLAQTASTLTDLTKAHQAMTASQISTEDRLALEMDIYTRALSLTHGSGASKTASKALGGVPLTKPDIRAKISSLMRRKATLERNPAKRIQLIDQANSLRKWTII